MDLACMAGWVSVRDSCSRFDVPAFHCFTRGGFAEAISSVLTVWLEPRAGTSPSCEAALSEFALGACSALSDHAFVSQAVPREGLDWCNVIMMGVTMVGDFLSVTFTHSELLAECLASYAVPGFAAPRSCFDSFLVSVPVVKS